MKFYRWLVSYQNIIPIGSYTVISIGMTIGFITFLTQMWEIGYTTADDVAASILKPDDILNQIYNAKNVRPNFYMSSILNYLRLIFPQTHFVFRIFTILPVVITVVSFSYFTSILFRNRLIGFASSFFLVASFQHTWLYHSLSAYPLNLNFSFSCIIWSLILFIIYFKKQGIIRNLCMFGIGILVSIPILVYEIFLIYILFFPILIIWIKFSGRSNFNKSDCFAILIFFIPILLSFIFIFSFHFSNADQLDIYPGIKLASQFNIFNYLQTVYTFTSSALPSRMFHYLNKIIAEYFGVTGKRFEFGSLLLDQFRLTWLIIPFVCSSLTYLILKSKNHIQLSKFDFIVFVIIASILIVGPNLLVSLIDKHQKWVVAGFAINYTGTHFSIFGWIFLFIIWLVFIQRFRSKLWKTIATCITILFTTIVIYRNQISNTAVVSYQSLTYSKWRLLEQMVQKGVFNNILLKNSLIITYGMWGEEDRYWEIFNPFVEWDYYGYWYKFSNNTFSTAGLPIVQSLKDCSRTFENCHERNNLYSLVFKISYLDKYSTLTFCPLEKDNTIIENHCSIEKFKIF